MTTPKATLVVRLTGQGRAAIASVLVTGPQAVEVVGRSFFAANGRRLQDQTENRIIFGRWQSESQGEELVVCRRDPSRVEIHCHGGQAAAAAIIATLVDAGCQEISWRQWLRQSELDPTIADAQIALAEATTERTAAVLLDQVDGALRSALTRLSASIDGGRPRDALEQVDALLTFAPLGLHLTQPWKVVLAGPPNVGKSSLINALVGYRRAIVHGTPGTTRDVVTAPSALEGWPVEFSDTAGLRDSGDVLEIEGMRQTNDRMAGADLVVLVFDASVAPDVRDQSLIAQWPSALQVGNKLDLVAASNPSRLPGLLYTSALDGEGVDALARAIAARLVPQVPLADTPVPFTPQQIEALREMRASLHAGQMVEAQSVLRRPTLAVRQRV